MVGWCCLISTVDLSITLCVFVCVCLGAYCLEPMHRPDLLNTLQQLSRCLYSSCRPSFTTLFLPILYYTQQFFYHRDHKSRESQIHIIKNSRSMYIKYVPFSSIQQNYCVPVRQTMLLGSPNHPHTPSMMIALWIFQQYESDLCTHRLQQRPAANKIPRKIML